MKEPGPSGPNTDVYWIGHGTVLLRAAPEHLKPAHAAEDMTEAAKDLCTLPNKPFRTSATEESPTSWTWARPTSADVKKLKQMRKKEKMTEMWNPYLSATCRLTLADE